MLLVVMGMQCQIVFSIPLMIGKVCAKVREVSIKDAH
jgi:hypothetical protein